VKLTTTLRYPPPGNTAIYTVSIADASSDEIARAIRIFEAAALAVEDKAPELFTGPPPLNTNPSDLPNYTPSKGL
jgi:hypothetical protein